MNFCDEMQVAEEGLFSKFKKKSGNEQKAFSSLDAAINSGITNKMLKIASSDGNLGVSFHGKSLDSPDQIKKVCKIVTGNAKKICSLCIDLIIKEDSNYSSKDKADLLSNAKIGYIAFYEKDGSVYANAHANTDASTQYYVKNITSSSDINAANTDYND